MTKPYSLACKKRMVERMTGKGAVSATRLEKETGIKQQSLSRWLREAASLPVMPDDKPKDKRWSVDEKIRVLATARELSGAELTAFLEKEGLHLGQLEQWRLALGEGGSKAVTNRIRKLERELARKEKALAEAAALLVLKKKLQHLWEDEDDDTDEESGK